MGEIKKLTGVVDPPATPFCSCPLTGSFGKLILGLINLNHPASDLSVFVTVVSSLVYNDPSQTGNKIFFYSVKGKTTLALYVTAVGLDVTAKIERKSY